MIYRQQAKYANQKITVAGETFDSKREFRRYQELLLLQRAGKITDLRRQVKYELVPAQREPDQYGVHGGLRKRGKVIENSVSYVADFVYIENGETVVEDAKGVRTDKYIIKRKLMLWVHGIRVREV